MVRLLIALTPLYAVVGYLIFTGFKYTRMISNIFMSVVYRPGDTGSFSQAGERLTVLDSSDREIEVLFAGPRESKKIILFCHESGSSNASWERYAHFLPRLGYGVLSVDFAKTHSDDQPNTFAQWPAWEDVERLVTVIRWTRRAFSQDAQVALFGVSNGADIALAASFKESSVKVVIADGLFSMKEIFRDYIRRWAPMLVKPNWFGERLPEPIVRIFADLGFWYSQQRSGKHFVDVEPLLAKKKVPLLLIYGESDEYISSSHRQWLENLHASALCDQWVVEKAGHNEAILVAPERYQSRIGQFLEKAFK